MGIEYRHSQRHVFIGLVMIRHHHIHTESSRQCDFFVRGRAAIGRHQQCDTLIMQALHGAEVESVAFAESMRNIGANLCVQPAKERQIDACRRNPIDIVIAVKTDRLLSRDGAMQPFDRLVHVGNQKWIVRRLHRHP